MTLTRDSVLAAVISIALGSTLLSQAPASPRANPAGNGRFTFGLIGDMPYGPEGELQFPNVIADLNADRTLAFVAHDGDIKNGSTLCNDEMFANRLDLFDQIAHPVIYVPGDNEWTDCHRDNNGGYDPLERLAFLRSTFFATSESLGRRSLPLDRQSALFPENVRWVVKSVMFAGLHIVGSNNNLGRTPEADAGTRVATPRR